MLHYLKIRDLALLEEAELELGEGFVAVTGETGAGKSILLGALSLLAGNRAERGLIRAGAEALEVEAALTVPAPERLAARLEELGLPPLEDGVLVLRRSLPRAKPARIQINGALATLTQLAELGEVWIDFHGPGEPQKLFKERWQLDLLDRFGDLDGVRERYAVAWRAWREQLAEIERVRTAERLEPEQIEFIKAQVERIDRAGLSEESVEALERDWQRLSKAEELRGRAAEIAQALHGTQGATPRLGPALQAARQLAAVDPGAAGLAARLQSLIIEAEDLAGDYEQLVEDCDFDPHTAERLRERMNAWQELRRRHGGDLESIRRRRDELARKLALQGDLEGTLIRLEHAAGKQEKVLREIAGELREGRVAAAATLTRKATGLINALGFKRARFKVEVRAEPALTEHGDSAVTFQFAANAGQDLLPLARIASSGESARVMLALKTVLAEADETPMLVFDEVDANIGGEIAAVVGRELAALGVRHQVVCVTHLAQVAACARQHWVVDKEQDADATRVTIRPVHGERAARITELARMLGDRNSSAAKAHARELLGR